MTPTEETPYTESENLCTNCNEPQMIPLSYDDLCLDCFGFKSLHGHLPKEDGN